MYYQIRGTEKKDLEERKLFEKIVYPLNPGKDVYNSDFHNVYIAFLTSRVSKDERLDGKKTTVRDCGGVDLQVFKGFNLERVLARYESHVDGYTYPNTQSDEHSPRHFPIDSIAVYVSLNLRNTEKATNEMLVEVLKRTLHKEDVGKKCDIRRYLMTNAVRGWNLIDMDVPPEKDLLLLKSILDEYLEEFFVIQTKAGYHWIFHNQMVSKARPDQSLHVVLKKYIKEGQLQSIDFGSTGMINNNGFTVVPGTFQRGHKVSFARDLCKGLDKYI